MNNKLGICKIERLDIIYTMEKIVESFYTYQHHNCHKEDETFGEASIDSRSWRHFWNIFLFTFFSVIYDNYESITGYDKEQICIIIINKGGL